MGKGLEYSFLSNWCGWDEIDTGDLQFNAITLNERGRELLGENADRATCMTLLTQSSTVEFYDENGDEPIATFNVRLTVV